jgi:hypothetical protein
LCEKQVPRSRRRNERSRDMNAAVIVFADLYGDIDFAALSEGGQKGR